MQLLGCHGGASTEVMVPGLDTALQKCWCCISKQSVEGPRQITDLLLPFICFEMVTALEHSTFCHSQEDLCTVAAGQKSPQD